MCFVTYCRSQQTARTGLEPRRSPQTSEMIYAPSGISSLPDNKNSLIAHFFISQIRYDDHVAFKDSFSAICSKICAFEVPYCLLTTYILKNKASLLASMIQKVFIV